MGLDRDQTDNGDHADGKPHSAEAAVCLGLIVPGLGQAYNGHPWRAMFYLLLTPLILPWVLSLVDAYAAGRRIERTGGRYYRGGLLWVFLHLWLVANVALLTLVGLTVSGVLQ